jgi:hypothetical protein
MTSSRDITISKINTPGVFRHTPFEHETTTDSGSALTTIEPVTITMVRSERSDRVTLIPSVPNLTPFIKR